jgi:hypothetical protein
MSVFSLILMFEGAQRAIDCASPLRAPPRNIDPSIVDLRLTAAALHSLAEEESSLDLADGFSFQVGASILELSAAPVGGWRFPITARMAGRLIVSFHLDIGMMEQQFAETLKAYTLPRTDRENSRVKDLVDMVLLLNRGIDPPGLRETIRRTFDHRATHPMTSQIPPPPVVAHSLCIPGDRWRHRTRRVGSGA